jgi:hypothetical protein
LEELARFAKEAFRMRTKWILAIAACAAMPAVAAAQTNPCADKACNIVFEWGSSGGSQPDVDRRFGSPADVELSFINGLAARGWKVATNGASSVVTITVRLTPQNKVLCEAMPGVNPDYSCHTVSRAAVVFVSTDTALKAPNRIDVNARCSDPKSSPSYKEFGRYAAEWVAWNVVEQGKGSRPAIKCL